MSIKTILIDVDGIIADFITHALRTLVGDENVAAAKAKHKKGDWGICADIGITDEEFWKAVDTPHFWESIPPYYGAVKFIRTLVDMSREHFRVQRFRFSTCSGGSKHFPNARTNWIREFNKMTGVKIPLIIVQEGKDKALCASSEALLIEDNEQTYKAFLEAGGYAVLLPRPWNNGVHDPSLGSVYDQVLDHVRRGLSGLAHEDIGQ